MDVSELARFRATPLADVLVAFGAERDPKDPQRNWRIEGSRIITTVEAGGTAKWFDDTRKIGGGGAIDLVAHLQGKAFKPDLTGRDFLEVMAWFRGRGGRTDGATPKLQPRAVQAAPESDARAPISKLAVSAARDWPQSTPSRIPRVMQYLTQQRAIPRAIVSAALRSGEMFADERGNVGFIMRDESLREIGRGVRGTWGKFYQMAAGSMHGITVLGSPRSLKAVFVESPIEALSYLALKGDAMMIATHGSLKDIPHRFVEQHLLRRGHVIVAAQNADRAGDSAAEKLMVHVIALGGETRRDRPDPAIGKDWNQILLARQRATTTRPAPSPFPPDDAMTR